MLRHDAALRTGEALTFFSIGDWGSRTSVQYDVAKELMVSAASLHPAFIVALGDNILRGRCD